MRLVIFILPILANLGFIQGYEDQYWYEDEDCKWEKRIKYVMDYVPTCCKESRYDWITKPGNSCNSQVKCSLGTHASTRQLTKKYVLMRGSVCVKDFGRTMGTGARFGPKILTNVIGLRNLSARKFLIKKR